MGTDISMYAEWRSHGQWQFIGRMVKNELYEYDPDHEMAYRPESLYDTRNYSLFAILADVRNGFMEDKYEYIAPRRGLPDDLSPELKTWLHTSFILNAAFHFVSGLKEYSAVTLSLAKNIVMQAGPKPMQKQQGQILWGF